MTTSESTDVTRSLASIPDAVKTVVSTRVRPDLHRVLVPPLPSWRLLSRGYLVGIPVLSVYFVFAVAALVMQKPVALSILVVVGLSLAAPLAVVIFAANHRLNRRLAFEVTPLAFQKISSDVFGSDRHAWPRSKLRDVGLNSLTGNLVAHIDCFETHEYFLTLDRAANQYVVDELRMALVEIAAAPSAEQDIAEMSEAMPPSRRRSTLLGAAVVLSVGGAFVAVCVPGAACLLFIPAAIAAGLVFGRQPRKEYWF